MTTSDFLASATRILFFTGKGGVGKTSLSCATALALADQGRRVLLVSTDPASNLDEVLGTTLSGEPAAVPGAHGLFALNIDPEAAAAEWRERVVGPYRGVLPDAAVLSMEEQLSGACTVEIAAFDQFTHFLGDPQATSAFDHVVFDTAPTGHTIRLLNLPAAWTGFIATNTTGTSCLGPLAGLESQKHLYESSLNALANPSLTTLVLVSRPEKSALTEAGRTSRELAATGMRNQLLVINGVFSAGVEADPVAAALESRGEAALRNMPNDLASIPRMVVRLRARPPMGIRGIRVLLTGDSEPLHAQDSPADVSWTSLSGLVEELAEQGAGVIMTMGKGGVGKTTIAAAVAVALCGRGHTVHLSTTDPAAHIAETINESVPGLRISRIDPKVETAKYTEEVIAEARAGLDQEGIALLGEDLRSPCTEEIAVFRAFAETVASKATDFVVLDTAPTGHTLLLLDAAEAYHREVSRKLTGIPDSVRELLPRLRDGRATRVLLITLPEATPVHEAGKLQLDLRRAGIEPFAWVVNQSFTPVETADAFLRQKALCEKPFLLEVSEELSSRMAVVPWMAAEPVGAERLRELVGVEASAWVVRQ